MGVIRGVPRVPPYPTLEDAFLDRYPLAGVKLRTFEALPGKDPSTC